MINGGSINGFAINESAAAAAVVVVTSTFNQRWEAFSLTEHTSRFNMRWVTANVIRYEQNYPLGMRIDMEVDLEFPLRLDASLLYTWGDALDVQTNYPLFMLGTVDTEFDMDMPLPTKEPVDAEINFPFSMQTTTGFVFPLAMLGDVDAETEYELAMTVTITAENVTPLPLLLKDPVKNPFRYLWSLVDETSVAISSLIQLRIKASGEVVEIKQGSVEMTEGAFIWTGNVELADIHDLSKFSRDTEIELDLDGEIYQMLVDEKDRSRQSPARVSGTLRLAGIPARKATPRATPLTTTFSTPIGAKAAVESILGESVTWTMIDWLIPANRLGAEDASPIEVAEQVAEAGGGVIESNPDGTIYVRNLYPVSVPVYDTATPLDTYLETDAILTLRERFAGGRVFNKIRIRDTTESLFNDRIEFEADEGDDRQGTLFVFPSPFRQVTVEHTSDGDISLIAAPEQLLDKVQLLEFKDGQTTTSHPVDSIDSVVWQDLDIGPVTFEVGATTLFSSDSVNKYSLATISYKARSLTWRTATSKDDDVQYLVRDV